jgi:hypothetical protein
MKSDLHERSAPQTTSGWRDRLHDLKNPLAAILANCQYLAVYGTLSPEDREVVNDIASSARALSKMLEQDDDPLSPIDSACSRP